MDRGRPRGKTFEGGKTSRFYPEKRKRFRNFVGSKMLDSYPFLRPKLRPSLRNIMMFVSGSVWFNKKGCKKMKHTLETQSVFGRSPLKQTHTNTKIVSAMSCGSGSLRVRTLGQIRWNKCTEPNNHFFKSFVISKKKKT